MAMKSSYPGSSKEPGYFFAAVPAYPAPADPLAILPLRLLTLIFAHRSKQKIYENMQKINMNFLDIRVFVPSGKDYERSKQLFRELGFEIAFEDGGMAGL
jgi:hypothetical protein